MSEQLAMQGTTIMEQVLMSGDLARLSPEQRTSYYLKTCDSLGLNPLTRPFEYITLNSKLTLYARKDATDQLRKLHSVSIDDVDIKETDSQFIVKVKGHDANGRTDVEIGVVNKSDMRGDTANAMMKAVTKGKRRLTLSLCGLGMLDETEIETIPDARPVVVTDHGEIVSTPAHAAHAPAPKINGGNFMPVQCLIDNKIAANEHNARALLDNYVPATAKTNAVELIAWGKAYRAWRDKGKEPAEAASLATDNVPLE